MKKSKSRFSVKSNTSFDISGSSHVLVYYSSVVLAKEKLLSVR